MKDTEMNKGSNDIHSSDEEVRRITEKLNSADTVAKDPRKRKEIIKTLLIVFLAAMLILTFFSNTIMNRALAEITTQSVTSGKLTERIRGYGVVEAEQSYEVTVDDNRNVETISVKAGQRVTEGDVLFILGSGKEQSLTAAEDELAALEYEYSKMLLNAPADYSTENQEIRNVAEDLEQAIKRRDAALAAKNTSAQALAQYKSDKDEAARLNSQKEKLTSAINSIDTDDYTTAPAELIGDLPALKKTYQAVENEYAAAYEIYTSAVGTGDAETALADCNAKDEKRNEAKSAYDSAKSEIRSGLAAQLSDTETKLGTVNSRISAYESSTPSSGMSYEDCVVDVQAKQRTLENLRISLAKTQTTNNIAQQQYDLDLENKRSIIEKKKQAIEALRGSSDPIEVVSKYSGTVRTVNVKPDDMTAAGVPLAVIDLDDAGFKLKVSVTAEQAAKVDLGTPANVVNNWSGDVRAVVSEISNDTESPSKKVMTFSVTGSVSGGSYLEVSIPLSREDYSAIVPKSAVYSDQDGDFVYKVRSKNTPLGNRYYAERVSVTVLASDDSSSAVSGGISGSDSVIVAFSKPVKAGDQVRLKSK